MVENRPWLNFFSHCSLWIAVLLICFPIYLAFVASTHTETDVISVPISLLPGDQIIQNYTTALWGANFQPPHCRFLECFGSPL